MAGLVLSLWTATALADALVVVRVQGEGAPEGRVTLTARRGGRTYSCETEEHTCRINGVPGGSYRVEFAPSEGETPPPRTAMIPPAGTVTLVVSAPSGR
jgi:hypothetical protein